MREADVGMSYREVAEFCFPFGNCPLVVLDGLFNFQSLLGGGNTGDKLSQVSFEHFAIVFLTLILVNLEEVESFILLGQTRPRGFD